jgi:hypothetical protein
LLHDIEFSQDENVVETSRKEFGKLQLESWNEFASLRNILIAELEQVSLSAEEITENRD